MTPSSDDFEIIDRQEASLGPEALAEIQAWLQPTDYMAESSEFRRHLLSQAPGTGLWICDTPRFCQWHDLEDHGSLWIKGVPGAGKSVIAASMVEHLKDTETVPILFFFFRYIIAANRRSRSLTRDWLVQLLPHTPRLQATLHPLLSCKLEDVSDETLWEHLLIGLSSIEKAYCIVDAIDEMEMVASDSFLRRLNSLATFRPRSIKLLMTSRPKQYLQSNLRDTSIVHISLEQDLVGKDIATFVSHRLRNALPDDDQRELRGSLELTICKRSSGLFLYARLLLDQIIPTLQSTPQLDVERLASSLPMGLEDMYNSMLQQQSQTLNIETSIQVFLLECATHASRPLRLNELASALACEFLSSSIPGAPKAIARSACSPLLEILEDETVQVIHHSFTEFLLDADRASAPTHGISRQFPVLNPSEVHKKFTMTCLSYLQSGVLGPKGHLTQNIIPTEKANMPYCACGLRSDCLCDKVGAEARLQYAFLEYTVSNWAHHASFYDVVDEEFFRAVTCFFNPTNSDFCRWLSLEWNSYSTPRSSQIRAPSALHLAAFAGLTKYATSILREGQIVHSLDADDRTPLHWACRRGHVEMASLLLQNGANPDAEDFHGVKPLHEAARKNHAPIVKMLLKAGVDPLTPKTRENHSGRNNPGTAGGEQTTKGETAIQYVCEQGHTESIQVMLPFVQPETLEELLCESCRYGKFEPARVVLECSNVSPDSKFRGGSALYLASLANNVKCVEALLARGADVYSMSLWKPRQTIVGGGSRRLITSTPLHALVSNWSYGNHIASQRILQLLVRAGADLELKDGYGDTPLLMYFGPHRIQDPKIVRALLEAGANVSAVDINGDTALHRFLNSRRDLKILELLIDHGADVNVRGNYGYNALLSALSSRHKLGRNNINEVVKYLLNKGVSCNVKDNHGNTPLVEAVSGGKCSLETIKLLLRACPDPDDHRRCLFRFGVQRNQEQRVEFIRELITIGVSLEARDSRGRTALLAVTTSDEYFQALLKCGARLDAVDKTGRGVLHHYISSSSGFLSTERLRSLIGMGLDPLQVDDDGNTILHEVVKLYRGTKKEIKFIELLLDLEISVNAKNRLGCTPLHVHLEFGRVRSSHDEHDRVPLLSLFQKGKESLDLSAQDAEGLTLLHLAALKSEIDVNCLLAAGADASILTNGGRSALHLACRARKSNIVGFLLHETGNLMIETADSSGRTPLHDACTSGRPESVYYLLKSGASVSVKDSHGRTPLHSCAEFSAEQHIWSLLQNRNSAAGQFSPDRFRPDDSWRHRDEPWYSSKNSSSPASTNHDSARIGGIVNSLLAAGASVTATDSTKNTPLDLALAYGCQEMVMALRATATEVQEPWEVGPADARFRTLLALTQRVAIPAQGLILPEESLQEILRNPVSYLWLLGHEDIDWIAKHGGEITGIGSNSRGQSLLHFAAGAGLTEIMESLGDLAQFYDDSNSVRALLKHKSVECRAESVAPVLHIACKRDLPNIEMLELLVDKSGVDVNGRALVPQTQWGQLSQGVGVEGPTALHILAAANSWWQLDAIRILVKRGANVNSRNEKGETPLHICSVGDSLTIMGESNGFWRPACVQLLLDLGADPNALDNDGLSCLHKASSAPEIMKTLLQHSADLSVGKVSPLFTAIDAQDLDALAVLLDVGASPNSKATPKPCHVHHNITDQEKWALFCASFPHSSTRDVKKSALLVKLLLARGADPYAPLNDTETLIHYVFEHAKYPIVCAFLECADKIDFNTKDKLGRTVFLAACNWDRGLPDYRNQMWYPKVSGPFLKLLDHGADPLLLDLKGRNPLHHLLDNPDVEVDWIHEFLKHDVAKTLLNARDGEGFTPLNCALRILRPTVVEALVGLGVNLLQPDPTGATALHQIASQCLRVHIHRGKSYDYPEHESDYYEGCLRLWQKFQDLGGDINVRDNLGSPPLFHYLSISQRDDFRGRKDPQNEDCCYVDTFAAYFGNADMNARNSSGETALHVIARREKTFYTAEKHERKLFEFFAGKGLDPLAEDERDRSALDVAAAYGKTGILELFQRE